MKKLILLPMLIFLFCVSTNTYSQSVTLGVGGGLTSVQGPDDFTNDISDGGLGLGSEFHYGAKLKVGVPLLPITAVGFVYNNSFGGSETIQDVDVETSWSMLTIGAGVEWTLLPGPVSGFATFDFLFNSFGKADGIEIFSDDDSDSRTGIGIGIGTEFTLLPKINLDATLKYQFNKMFGKEDDEEAMDTINLTVNVLFSII